MIRTCRLFFPVRNTYNVSLFNQRTEQRKQILLEFSFRADQRKGNHLQKGPLGKVEFSTFKEQGKIKHEANSENKSKNDIPSECVTCNADDISQKTTITSLSEAAQKMNVDFSTIKQDLKSTSAPNKSKNQSFRKNAIMHRRDENSMEFMVTDKQFEIESNVKPGQFYSQENMSPSDVIKTSKGFLLCQKATKISQLFCKQLISTCNMYFIQIFKVMVKTGNRSPNNLKACTAVLMSNENSFSLTQASNVLYSCAKLSFANLPLLNFMSSHILSGLEKERLVAPRELVSLLQSVCKLKYRNCELIEALCKKLISIEDLLSTEQTTLCLFALSNVNVQSEYADHFINTLSKLKNTDFDKTRNFLNYVWASVILKKENSLPLEHLEIVLSKSFTEKLNICGDNTLLNKIKLSNISGIASDMENYKGPLLEHLILSPVLSKSKNYFLTTVRDSLSYIFPKTGFMEALAYAGSGVFIDIECCLDSSSNPILLKSKEMYNKVAMILLDHSDFCLEDDVMTGVTAFKIERIKKQNYKVLTIPYSEFPSNSALSHKIAYLRNKFKKVIAKAPDQ